MPPNGLDEHGFLYREAGQRQVGHCKAGAA